MSWGTSIVDALAFDATEVDAGATSWRRFRVLRAADRFVAWRSEEVMKQTIGHFINANIDAIRRTTAAGKDFEALRVMTNHPTGKGWLTAKLPSGELVGGLEDNLTGFSIIIKPRLGHVPTAADPERWYVLTAFRELGRRL